MNPPRERPPVGAGLKAVGKPWYDDVGCRKLGAPYNSAPVPSNIFFCATENYYCRERDGGPVNSIWKSPN